MFNANGSHPLSRRAAVLAVNTAKIEANRAKIARNLGAAKRRGEQLLKSLR